MLMSHHQARVCWQRLPARAFTDHRYSRAHRWIFGDGLTLAASSAASSLPYSKAENLDPEEGAGVSADLFI
jgi:hypothetical protein